LVIIRLRHYSLFTHNYSLPTIYSPLSTINYSAIADLLLLTDGNEGLTAYNTIISSTVATVWGYCILSYCVVLFKTLRRKTAYLLIANCKPIQKNSTDIVQKIELLGVPSIFIYILGQNTHSISRLTEMGQKCYFWDMLRQNCH
jgi:hypothetical protein